MAQQFRALAILGEDPKLVPAPTRQLTTSCTQRISTAHWPQGSGEAHRVYALSPWPAVEEVPFSMVLRGTGGTLGPISTGTRCGGTHLLKQENQDFKASLGYKKLFQLSKIN